MDLREGFFTGRMGGHWNRLLCKAVMAPGLLDFREPADNGSVSGSPAKSRELNSMILMVPFRLEIFYDSMNIVYTTT